MAENAAGSTPAKRNIWANGQAYENYIGRWSRLVAPKFLAWLDRPPGLRWLDVGCGTGVLSQTILNLADPAEIYGLDSSEGFLSLAREQVPAPQACFTAGDAQDLPFAPASFDNVVSALLLNFLPNPGLAVREMRRVAVPGGTVGLYVWDYAGKMEMLRYFWDAAATMAPAGKTVDEGVRFELCQPEPLEKLFRQAGLVGVEVEGIEVPSVFRDFNDFWEPFLGGQGPGPGYVAKLDPAEQDALREYLRRKLPVQPDNSIQLTARVWAVRGQKAAS